MNRFNLDRCRQLLAAHNVGAGLFWPCSGTDIDGPSQETIARNLKKLGLAEAAGGGLLALTEAGQEWMKGGDGK